MDPYGLTRASVEFALNLCDVLDAQAAMQEGRLDDIVARQTERSGPLGFQGFSRIYIGSYFCERFFLALGSPTLDAIGSWARSHGLRVSLVVPIFGQATVEQGMWRVARALDPAGAAMFDEVVVNDPATASDVRDILGNAYPDVRRRPRMIRGRLMMKAHRDPRYPHLFREPAPVPYDARMAERDLASWCPSMVECDPFAPTIDLAALDEAIPVALHLPHAVMSVGRICLAASQTLPACEKFRPGRPCTQDCLRGLYVHETPNFDDGSSVFLTRQGRAVFFENPGCRVVGGSISRVVWTPADYLCPHIVEDDSWE